MLEKIILGTVQFGLDYGINNKTGKPSDEEVEKILLSAYKNKIFFLDTAEAYGDAQKRIGLFHSKHPDKRFNIITKFYQPLFSGNIRNQILNDVKDLNVEFLYSYLFHSFQDLNLHTNHFNELIKLKEQGLINKIGVSLYTNEEIEEVLRSFDFIELVQIPFNLLDNMNQRGKWLEKMKEKGIEVHTRSAFLQGLFFKEKIPENLSVLTPYIKLIKDISKKHSLSITELALNYCLNQPLIDKV